MRKRMSDGSFAGTMAAIAILLLLAFGAFVQRNVRRARFGKELRAIPHCGTCTCKDGKP